MPGTQVRVCLSPALIGRVLAVCVGALTLASVSILLLDHLVGPHVFLGQSHLRRLLDLGHELNLPTWFSSVLMLLSSLLLATLAGQSARCRWRWGLLALVFLALSADEVASVHEGLSYTVRLHRGLSGPAYADWVAPATALTLVLGLLCLPLLREVPRQPRSLMLLSAALFLAGTVGLELVAASYLRAHSPDLTVALIGQAEEALELAGVALFTYALAVLLTRLEQTSAPPVEESLAAQGRG